MSTRIDLPLWTLQQFERELARLEVEAVLGEEAHWVGDSLEVDSTLPSSTLHKAARLLGWDLENVVADRFATIEALIEKFRCTVVLKGAGTLDGDGEASIGVCDGGNPGMASGGMGDVLSGIVGALLAQGLSAIDSARVGVCVHARAADAAAAQAGERGLLATDLMADVRRLLNA